MDGHKEVRARFVRFHGFLIRGFIYIRSAGVQHVDPPTLQDLSHSKREGKRVVLLLTAVVDRPGILSPVSGIQHDRIWHIYSSLQECSIVKYA